MSKREQWLRAALADILELDMSEISLTESFAAQGVDSLAGLRLARALQDALGVEIELECLFDRPSIRELSQFLDEQFGELDSVVIQ